MSTHRPTRVRIDLFKRLSSAALYAVALSIVIAVVAAAWLAGRDDPVPAWISDGLVPALGWIYLALLVVAGAHVLRRRRALGRNKEDEKR